MARFRTQIAAGGKDRLGAGSRNGRNGAACRMPTGGRVPRIGFAVHSPSGYADERRTFALRDRHVTGERYETGIRLEMPCTAAITAADHP